MPISIKECLVSLSSVLKTNSSIVSTPRLQAIRSRPKRYLALTLDHRALVRSPVFGPSRLAPGEPEEEGIIGIASILAASDRGEHPKLLSQKAFAAEQVKFW